MEDSPEWHEEKAREWERNQEALRQRSMLLEADVPWDIVDDVMSGELQRDAPPVPEFLAHLEAGRRMVLLAGPPGTGKTCAAVMGVLPNRIVSFVTAEQFVSLCSSFTTAPKAERLRERPVLILDDLGEEPADEKSATAVRNLITHRYNLVGQKLTTLMTTNLKPRRFGERYGDRILSRMRDPRHTAIVAFKQVMRPKR